MKLWLLITKGYTWRYSPCICHLKRNYFPSCGIVNLLKIRFFSVRQIFMRGTRLRLKHFDIVCMQQKFLCEPYLPSGKLPFWPFWEEKDMYSRRRALNAKELNTWVNDDQGNIDYWRHGKGECLKFHPNTPEFPNAVKQLRCSMVQ